MEPAREPTIDAPLPVGAGIAQVPRRDDAGQEEGYDSVVAAGSETRKW